MLCLSFMVESTAADRNISVTFLDEFRIMVLTPQSTQDVPEFTLFDTLVPHGYPVNSRRFRLPPRYHNWIPSAHVDGDRCLGTPDRDRPLITDPTQAVLVVKLAKPHTSPVLFIVRVQTLIEYVCSTSTDTCVPWDMWGRGAVVMELPTYGSGPYPLVQGVHVILVKMHVTPSADGSSRDHLHTFDLGRRGCSLLPLWDKGIGTERRVSFKDGREFFLQVAAWMLEWGFNSLGDGKFMYLVSRFCRWKCGGRLTPCQDQLFWFRVVVARVGADLSRLIIPTGVTRIGVRAVNRWYSCIVSTLTHDLMYP